MRVLLATSSFLPGIGGAEVAIHHLAEGLVSLGHAAAVCVFQRREGPEHERSYELLRTPPPRGLGALRLDAWWMARKIRRVAASWAPDVIHAHFAWPTGSAAVAARADGPAPVVLTCHGEDIQIRPDVGYGYRLQPRLDRRIREAVRCADLLTAVGRAIEDEYVRLGVPASQVVLIPNGIDCATLARSEPEARSSLGLPADRTAILAVGRNHPKKGFVDLVRAMAIVRSRHPQALCLIVGRDVSRLGPLVESLDLAGHVRLREQVLPAGIRLAGGASAAEGVETCFHAADLYAMPSLIEAAGIVTVEAMAAGLPVVARRAPGTEDLVEHGKNGLLVDDGVEALAGALGRLLEDAELRRRLGQAGREKARAFDRVTIAARHVEAYERARSLRAPRPLSDR